MRSSWRHLHAELTIRQLRSGLGGVGVSWIWYILAPLLLLSVYSFVFGVIFKARVPEGLGIPFVAWLAVALWPWFAFSDGVLRGAHSIRQHAGLVAKLAIPRTVLSSSTQTAAFILQTMGFGVVLVALLVLKVPVDLRSFPYLLLVILTLYLFSLGLSFLFSALQVFLRDLEQILPTIFMFWFFLTPIIYAPSMLPEQAIFLLYLNPMTWWVEEIRAALFQGKWLPDHTFVLLLLVALITLWIGKQVFHRLSPHFEDFL